MNFESLNILKMELQNNHSYELISDSAENVGDQIKSVLKWKDNPDLGKLAGKPVRLRFVLSDADLYSFSFGD